MLELHHKNSLTASEVLRSALLDAAPTAALREAVRIRLDEPKQNSDREQVFAQAKPAPQP